MNLNDKQAFLKAWARPIEFKKLTKVNGIKPDVKSKLKQILWVDDDFLNDQALIDIFRKDQIIVVTENDSASAMQTLKENKFDLIISDIARPADSSAGIRLLRGIQSMPGHPPVVMSTSQQSQEKFGSQALKEGALNVYIKSYDLLKAVRNLLKNNR